MAREIACWNHPPDRLELGQNQIDLWRVDLDSKYHEYEELRIILDKHELDRANRFKFEIDRQRFIASHAVLRIVLSKYIGVLPHNIRLDCGPFGKPLIAMNSRIEFNMTHSGANTLIAVGTDQRIGADIETIDLEADWQSAASTCFSSDLITKLTCIPKDASTRLFYEHWVCMEASHKAAGEGLLALSGPAATLWNGTSKYFLNPFLLGASTVGAIAAERPAVTLHFYHFDEA